MKNLRKKKTEKKTFQHNHGYAEKKKIYWKANSYERSEYQSCFAYSRFLTSPPFLF